MKYECNKCKDDEGEEMTPCVVVIDDVIAPDYCPFFKDEISQWEVQND